MGFYGNFEYSGEARAEADLIMANARPKRAPERVSSDHPSHLVQRLFDGHGVAVADFRAYLAASDSKSERVANRYYRTWGKGTPLPEFAAGIEAPEGMEVGLTSYVRHAVTSDAYHVPMIDFACAPSWERLDQLQRLWPLVVPDSWPLEGLHLFESGRSYHAYHEVFLPEKLFSSWLGWLLLIDNVSRSPSEPEGKLIDTGWAGASHDRGYMTLRWTSSEAHPQAPAAVPSSRVPWLAAFRSRPA